MNKIIINKNQFICVITVFYLVPKPQLNALIAYLIKRLWRYIKNYLLKNKVHNTMTELENAIYEFLRNLGADVVKSAC